MQVDLLRVLEEKRVTQIGDRTPVDVDFRLISATCRNLKKEIAASRFRDDFFYRINVITINIPPLRERKEDIALLVNHFLNKYSHETTKKVDHVTPDAMRLLSNYDWPGNVRELQNAIERAVVLSRSRTLELEDFSFLRSSSSASLLPKRLSLEEMEKEYIILTLKEQNWNITHAARTLDINRVTLHKKINRFNLKKG